MTISQPDIDRIGIDTFVGNIVVNVQRDLNGGRSKSDISEYYMMCYNLDVSFSESILHIRLYTESEGWNQSSHEISFK